MPPPPPPSPDDGRERNLCERSFSSRTPIPPACIPDICLNVPDKQVTGPCADQVCVDEGGTWNGISCDFPPPPPPTPACADGIDNDGDGDTDFPEDTGCTSTGDSTENDFIGPGLRVMLASDNPAGGMLVQGQGIAHLAKLTFTNDTDAAVTITGLSFSRIGNSTNAVFGAAYLFQGTQRITDPGGISGSALNFNNSNGILTVPPGSSVTVSVRVDIGISSGGQQVGIQLTTITASAPLDASVVLPISGGLFLISNATIATATWGPVIPSGVVIPVSNNVTLFQSWLTVNTHAVWLHSIQFESRGTTEDSHFANLRLYVNGVQVGGSTSIVNDKVFFDISANPPRLETGPNQIRLVGDIVGGSGETFDFQIRRGADIFLVDSVLDQPLKLSALIIISTNIVEGIRLSVLKADTSPTSNVALGSTGVLWSRFEFRAHNDNLKIEQITLDVDSSVSNSTMHNVRVMLDGVQIGSTADIPLASGWTFALGSSLILVHGRVYFVEIYGDAKQSDGTNYTSGEAVDVGVSINNADTEGIGSGNRLPFSIVEVEGNVRTVSSSGGDAGGGGGVVPSPSILIDPVPVDTSVPPGEVALGSFSVGAKESSAAIISMAFTMDVVGLDQDYLIDFELVRKDGTVVGAYNDILFSNGQHTSTFFNTPALVSLMGTTTYTLRATLPVSTRNGTTIALSTDPASGWSGTWTSGTPISFAAIRAFNMGTINVINNLFP